MSLRKRFRRYLARPELQWPFRTLYRIALAGMNYGGAASASTSGDELALLRIAKMPRTRAGPLVVFDVGANEGSYVAQVLQVLGDDVMVYAFEPSLVAFTHLARAFGTTRNVHPIQAGLGAAAGPATLWSHAPGSVLASTYPNPINGQLSGESIALLTLDRFCEHQNIERIDLLKIDVEGGELDTIRGARRLLDTARIDIIQFEFGQPSLGSRTYFGDLFRLLVEQYEIFRVLPTGLAPIAKYHETLEVFMSTNYLAVTRRRMADFAGRR